MSLPAISSQRRLKLFWTSFPSCRRPSAVPPMPRPATIGHEKDDRLFLPVLTVQEGAHRQSHDEPPGRDASSGVAEASPLTQILLTSGIKSPCTSSRTCSAASSQVSLEASTVSMTFTHIFNLYFKILSISAKS